MGSLICSLAFHWLWMSELIISSTYQLNNLWTDQLIIPNLPHTCCCCHWVLIDLSLTCLRLLIDVKLIVHWLLNSFLIELSKDLAVKYDKLSSWICSLTFHWLRIYELPNLSTYQLNNLWTDQLIILSSHRFVIELILFMSSRICSLTFHWLWIFELTNLSMYQLDNLWTDQLIIVSSHRFVIEFWWIGH